jgi:hypothetical protein
MPREVEVVHHPDRRTDVKNTTTVEVSRLATRARCKLEITAIAVAAD